MNNVLNYCILFSDLTTLMRATDATLERQGFKFSIACGFGLSKARLEYQNYKVLFMYTI